MNRKPSFEKLELEVMILFLFIFSLADISIKESEEKPVFQACINEDILNITSCSPLGNYNYYKKSTYEVGSTQITYLDAEEEQIKAINSNLSRIPLKNLENTKEIIFINAKIISEYRKVYGITFNQSNESDGRKIIYINLLDNPLMEEVICHELAHTFLDMSAEYEETSHKLINLLGKTHYCFWDIDKLGVEIKEKEKLI